MDKGALKRKTAETLMNGKNETKGNYGIKGTVNVISSDPPLKKRGMLDSQRYPV